MGAFGSRGGLFLIVPLKKDKENTMAAANSGSVGKGKAFPKKK